MVEDLLLGLLDVRLHVVLSLLHGLHPVVPPLPLRLPLEPEDAPAHEEPVDDLDARQQGEPHAEPQEAADVGDEVSHAVEHVALVLSVGLGWSIRILPTLELLYKNFCLIIAFFDERST